MHHLVLGGVRCFEDVCVVDWDSISFWSRGAMSKDVCLGPGYIMVTVDT